MIALLLLQVVLIALNAVFACAEIAVISVNDNKLEKMAAQGDKRAIKLLSLTSQPAKFLATIQVAITLSGFLGSAFAADNFSDTLVEWMLGLGVRIPRATLDSLAVVVITLILSYFTLVFGELVPKQVAMRKAEPLALAMAGLIGWVAKICAPIVWSLSASANTILRILGIDPDELDEEVGEEEIRMMVDAGSEKGTIAREEQELIHNVFEFDNLTADEIATHRTEVELLWMEEGPEEWEETIFGSRHTYYPVCGESVDEVLGILNTKEYFRLGNRSRDQVMLHAVRPAFFIPESMRADVLFRAMKKNRESLAVVLDEYGGVCGIITMNDLLEKLVGDFAENDEQEPYIQKTGEDTWEIYGNVLLEDVQAETGEPLEHENYETFSGLIFDSLGKVPKDGEQLTLELAGLSIGILEIRGHQVRRAVLKRRDVVDNREKEAYNKGKDS